MKTYLVKNIKFNNGQPVPVKVPTPFTYGTTCHGYLRTLVLNYCEVTFDFEELNVTPNTEFSTPVIYSQQPYDINVVDDYFKSDVEKVECLVTVLCYDQYIVRVDDTEEDFPDDLGGLILDELKWWLPIEFMLETYIK